MKRILLSIVIIIFISMTALALSAEVITDEGKLPFKDVGTNAWYHDTVVYSYLNGYIMGTSDTTMSPSQPLTRESAVSILARISGDDLSVYNYQSRFADVKSGMWYTKEINWANAHGYVEGMNPTTFGIGKQVTREQFARILYLYVCDRYNAEPAGGDMSRFTDVDEISEWAYEAIDWCVFCEIISGTSPTTLSPRSTMTRAQMAVITKNFTLAYVYGDCEHRYTKASCTEPSACSLCGVGVALPTGHRCERVTCIEGSNCKYCGYYIPADPSKHSFGKATCTLPARCRYCAKVSAPALGHSYSNATCTQASKCSRCSAITGAALGHTTYNGKCGRCYTFNYRAKILTVPYIDQRYYWPNGCEAVSCTMALQYNGIDITVDQVIDGYLPTGGFPDPGGYGPDPDLVYCGDPRSSVGWGCYSPVIVHTLKTLILPQYWNIDHSYSLTLAQLCDRYIDRGIPVMVWTTTYMSDSYSYAYWRTYEGKQIAYNRKLHCMLLVGYDKDNYYFNDPLNPGTTTKYRAYPKAKSEKAFTVLGKQSIALYPKN